MAIWRSAPTAPLSTVFPPSKTPLSKAQQPEDFCKSRASREQKRRPPETVAFIFFRISGPEGVRTPDLMTASHARSQLRHRPPMNFKHRIGNEEDGSIRESSLKAARYRACASP